MNLNNTFRHILIAASAIALAVSCSVDIENNAFNQQSPSDKAVVINPSEPLTIKAVMNVETGVKTSLQSNGGVWWSKGDALSVFYGRGENGGSKFTADIEESSAISNFRGVIDVVTGGGEISMEDTWFWATYPYNSNASCDGSSITTALPSEQTGCKGSFSDDTFVTVAKSRGLLMSFYNVCSGLKFSVTRPDVERVKIKTNGGEKIAGTMKVKFDDNSIPYVSEIIDGTDEVIVNAPDGGCFEVGESYYIVILPQQMSSGFTVTIDTWYEEATREISKAVEFKRSVFNTMMDADKSVEYVEKPFVEFEDANFEAYCLDNFDTDKDGKLSKEEAEAVTEIDVHTQIVDGTISTLKGIGVFRNLERLDCSGTFDYETELPTGQLASLDISKNVKLTELNCSSNQLNSLDVSNNIALTSLNCSFNQLSSLDVSQNTALTDLWCSVNHLISLDVSKNTKLTILECGWNKLDCLDVSNNTLLDRLGCDNNQLSTLDVSNNTALEYLTCSSNQLNSLDVSNNTALKSLWGNYNNLISLDVSHNTELKQLLCSENQLNSLDVSKNIALTALACTINSLSSLDVSHNTALTSLACSINQLNSLDVSHNTSLALLMCDSNNLSSLDVSNNIALNCLICCDNPLLYLYISQGQTIPNITEDRSAVYIPEGTTILVGSSEGGNEGTVTGENF